MKNKTVSTFWGLVIIFLLFSFAVDETSPGRVDIIIVLFLLINKYSQSQINNTDSNIIKNETK